MENTEINPEEQMVKEAKTNEFYKIGFFVVLGVSFVLLLTIIAFILYKFSSVSQPQDEFFKEQTQLIPLTATSMPEVSVSTPTPTTNFVITFPTKTPTPTIAEYVFKSSLCPVEFRVRPEKIFITSKNQYGIWQMLERKGERFKFIPRAEETNGEETEVELRAEGQIYGNGEGKVTVGCQDNPNRWGNSDFLSYVIKNDYMDSYQLSVVKLWGKDINKMEYVQKGTNTTSTVWLFATPNKLVRVEKFFYNSEFNEEVEKIFQNLRF